MEENSLFNPGFLGAGGFHWWVGQIMDDAKWRENISDKKISGAGEVPGWGYRYKVRIIGLHDKEEETVPSDQLPWAQCMYPITAGGGQAGARQTPNLRQGNFVFGFFLDGAEQEVPVIMGVLGNNAQTTLKKETGTTASNFAGTSGYAKGEKPDPALKVSDEYILTDNATFKEDSTTVHLLQTADVKRNDLYTSFTIPLASPCKKQNSEMSNIQTTIQNLTYEINKIQQEFLSPIDAAARSNKKVAEVIKKATDAISGYMKSIMDKVRSFVLKEYNKKISPTVDKIFPNSRQKLLELKEKANTKLVCLFNKIIGELPGLIGSFLNKSYSKYKDKPTKESEMISPPVPSNDGSGKVDDYVQDTVNTPEAPDATGPRPIPGYEEREPTRTPTPICSVEALVGNVLGNTLPEITREIDQAIAPVDTFLVDYLTEISQIPGGIETVNASGVLNTRGSSLTPSITSSAQAQINTSAVDSSIASIADVANSIEEQSLPESLRSLVAGRNFNVRDFASTFNADQFLDQAATAAAAAGALSQGDILGAAAAVPGQVGQVAGQVGGVVSALENGDLLGAAAAVGGPVANIVGQASQLLGQATSLIGNIVGNITSALNFINSIVNFFKCDDEPQCPSSLGYRLHDGSVGTKQENKPNNTAVAEAAKNAEAPDPSPPAQQPFATPTQGTTGTQNVNAQGTATQSQPFTQSEIDAAVTAERNIQRTGQAADTNALQLF